MSYLLDWREIVGCKWSVFWEFCFWDVISDRKLKAAKAAFNASIDIGITFIDTAEIYGAPVRYIFVFIFTYYFYVPKNTFANWIK